MDAKDDDRILYSLDEARKRFLPCVSRRQFAKYASAAGCDGIRVETAKVGAKRVVSRSAIERFVEALFENAMKPKATPRRARTNDADAYSTLDRLGVKWNKPDSLKTPK